MLISLCNLYMPNCNYLKLVLKVYIDPLLYIYYICTCFCFILFIFLELKYKKIFIKLRQLSSIYNWRSSISFFFSDKMGEEWIYKTMFSNSNTSSYFLLSLKGILLAHTLFPIMKYMHS